MGSSAIYLQYTSTMRLNLLVSFSKLKLHFFAVCCRKPSAKDQYLCSAIEKQSALAKGQIYQSVRMCGHNYVNSENGTNWKSAFKCKPSHKGC